MNILTDKELEEMNTTKPIKYKEHIFPQRYSSAFNAVALSSTTEIV